MSLALYRSYQHVESFSRFVARDVRSYLLAEDLHDDSLVILAACLVPDDGCRSGFR
jgi:hypothetical protein